MTRRVQFSLSAFVLAVILGGSVMGLVLASGPWQEIAVLRLPNVPALPSAQLAGAGSDNTAAIFFPDGKKMAVFSKPLRAIFVLSIGQSPQVIWGRSLILHAEGILILHLDPRQDALVVGVLNDSGVRSVAAFKISDGSEVSPDRLDIPEDDWSAEEKTCFSFPDKERKLADGYRRFVGHVDRLIIKSTYAYCPSGEEYALGKSDEDVVVVLNGESNAVATLDTRHLRIEATCYSDDGRFLAGVGRSSVFLWERRRHYGLRGHLEQPYFYVATLAMILLCTVVFRHAPRVKGPATCVPTDSNSPP